MQALRLGEVDERQVEGRLDVTVRIGAAGQCRTDLPLHVRAAASAPRTQFGEEAQP